MTKQVIFKPAGRIALCKLLLAPVFLIAVFTKISFGREVPGTRTHHKYFHGPCFTNFVAAVNLSVPANDTVPFNFTKLDNNKVTRYLINGVFFIDHESISFSLNDSALINYKIWKVAAGNRISYSDKGVLVTNFSLSRDSAAITMSSPDSIAGSPISVSIHNEDISDLTGLIGKDTAMASGLLNATFLVRELDKALSSLTGAGSITNFELMRQPIGDLQFNAQLRDKNTIHGTINLEGNDNSISANGNFCLKDCADQLDVLLDIKKLRSTVLGGFIQSGINLFSGSINGQLALKGNFKRPEWAGVLHVDSTRFMLNQFGSTYLVDGQKISLDYPVVGLKDFTIQDSLGNPLIINGNLSSKKAGTYDLDLAIDSRDFSLINTSRAINNQLYGYTGINGNLSVTGTATKPVIEGDLLLNGKTAIAIVLPEKNTNEDAARSVVKFIDRDTFVFSGKEAFKTAAVMDTAFAKFLNYKLTIRADKQAAVTIIIDPTTGDLLTVKGITKLNTGIKTGGNIVLSGAYQLDSGYYELNYQFLRQRFNILKGGTIYFGGSPGDAQINVSAEYITKTAAKNLLGNEVGIIDPKIARSFNEKIPFKVILSLRGSLNNPVISFNIELPAENTISPQLRNTIENKLVQLRGDASATNKQVFALLVLDRFVGEQSTDFFKGNGGDFSDVSRENVSKFLSASLDQIASDLFKGINVDLNLNSYKDFTSNDGTQKADLNLEVSKNFLNDRLTVTVGKNFGIESRDASTKASQQKASRFLPDVTVNYKFSADGKYMLRSYKKNPFEVILDGYVVETGLSFIVTMDYEKFKELKELVKVKDQKPGK